MFYIYILYSACADKYDIGHTDDVQRRIIEHNEQKNFGTYLSKFRPWKLAAYFEYGNDRSAAIKLERFIKRQHSRKLIEQLIDPEFEPAGNLAPWVRVPHVRD